MKANIDKLKLSYSFFKEKQNTNTSFLLQELAESTEWSISTVRTYLSKKWHPFLIKNNQQYSIDDTRFAYSEEEYVRMMSQVQENSSNPYKPILNEQVEALVTKAKESAILAIDIYNRPSTLFRSQGFTVMMIIAWTSLLHAIFENANINYWYYKDDDVIIVDGDKKAWELSKCIGECDQLSKAIKENIKLFIAMRNKIEHRFCPVFDLEICGECQAFLLNFEEIITKNFGNYYSLNSTLTIPLQIVSTKTDWQIEIVKQLHSTHYSELKKFIDSYRKKLPNDIYNDMKYSFRVYLLQKTGNHRSSSDIAMEFVKYDPAHPEQFAELEKGITLIKEKRIEVANPGKYKPSHVSTEVFKKLGKPFTAQFHHAKAWKYYKVRKSGKQADGCNTKYCQYDEAHGDYIYTKEWIDFLVTQLTDNDEYEKIKAFK